MATDHVRKPQGAEHDMKGDTMTTDIVAKHFHDYGELDLSTLT